ncbi:MAG: hypothetical protein ACI3VR_12700 [Intestinibacter sp.]|uniref:hypothetical protein n=1 Tax=Intestinibacter sp. TaxID=1965304 RepID=UPI003F18A586
MRKSTLLISLMLIIPALLGSYSIDLNTLWVISSLIPFLALLAVTESTRSAVYGMIEFEMSTRFSLKSVMLARLSILGMLDFIILCCVTPLCCISSEISLFQTAIYLFVPYLLTVNTNLWITRHFQGKESIYACMSVAVLISGLNVSLHFIAKFIYQLSYFNWWLLLAVILTAGMINELSHTIKQTEEYRWNLSLTD